MANYQLTQSGQQIQNDLDLTEHLQQSFSTSSTYAVNDIVVYNTRLYKCHTAVSSAGAWTGNTNWTEIQLDDIGFANPMTTAGDIIYGGTSGAPTRLAKGTTGQILMQSLNAPVWTTINYMANPMSAQGDIIYGGSGGAPTRLAKGTTGNLLRAGSTSIEYTDSLPVLTTAPSAANTDGIKIVILNSEPSTKYDGYLYLIVSAS